MYFLDLFVAQVHMNYLTGDLIKGFLELMALSTAHAIFASKMHTSGLFLHVHKKAACSLLLGTAEYPYPLVHLVQ